MKKNIFVRLLAALGGIVLWLLALCALAEVFFRIPLTAKVGQLLNAGTPAAVLITLVAAIVLCVLGTCCLMMLSGKRAVARKGFVMQKGENGAIGVSIKSIEGLVQTCVKQHEVVENAKISVVERRDGIVILLNIEEAAGVNIPLAVGALQKQIKQYVNTCTGVDVHEVRVMVENTERSVSESPFAVEKPVVMTTAATAAEMHREAAVEPEMPTPVLETPAPVEEAPAAEAAPVLESPAYEAINAAEAAPVQEAVSIPVVPVTPIIPVMPEIAEEEDDRPLHQRLFGMEEEPVFVPAPPELVIEPQTEEVAEEAPAEIAEEAPVLEIPDEEAPTEIEADAVLSVVEAIAEEEALAEDEYAVEDMAEYDEEVLAEEAILDGADEETEKSAE